MTRVFQQPASEIVEQSFCSLLFKNMSGPNYNE
jgi:hypothetical protein